MFFSSCVDTIMSTCYVDCEHDYDDYDEHDDYDYNKYYFIIVMSFTNGTYQCMTIQGYCCVNCGLDNLHGIPDGMKVCIILAPILWDICRLLAVIEGVTRSPLRLADSLCRFVPIIVAYRFPLHFPMMTD